LCAFLENSTLSLDPTLREQLVDARERISLQIEELLDLAKFSYKDRPPDCRDVYADLQSQLRDIDELLESRNEDDSEGIP
jgi:hypothetical protein